MYEIIADPFQRHQIILDAIEKKKAQLAILYSYRRPIPDPWKGKGHLGRTMQQLEQEIVDLEEENRKLLLQAEQRRLLVQAYPALSSAFLPAADVRPCALRLKVSSRRKVLR